MRFRLRKKRVDPRWESFEPYKGEGFKELHPWLNALVIGVVSLLLLSIVFVVCGLLAFALPYGGRRRGNRLAEWEPQWFPMFRFIVGGALGVVFAIYLYWKKNRARNG